MQSLFENKNEENYVIAKSRSFCIQLQFQRNIDQIGHFQFERNQNKESGFVGANITQWKTRGKHMNILKW